MIRSIILFKLDSLKPERWNIYNGKIILKTKRKILTLNITEDYNTIQTLFLESWDKHYIVLKCTACILCLDSFMKTYK